MATDKKPSILIFFEGENHRIFLEPNEKTLKVSGQSYTHKSVYKSRGNTYAIEVVSHADAPNKAKVSVYSATTQKLVACRPDVDVRFYKKLLKYGKV